MMCDNFHSTRMMVPDDETKETKYRRIIHVVTFKWRCLVNFVTHYCVLMCGRSKMVDYQVDTHTVDDDRQMNFEEPAEIRYAYLEEKESEI